MVDRAMVRFEEGAVENIMDFGGRGKGQTVSYCAAAKVLLADPKNGDPAMVEGHVGVAVGNEGNNHNGKRTR